MTETQKKLAEENHNLIYWFLNKYHLSIDEYYDLAAIGLCKAAKTYNDEQSSFSTYAARCMFTAVFSEIRNEKNEKRKALREALSLDAAIEGLDNEQAKLLDVLSTSDTTEDIVLAQKMLEDYYVQTSDKDKQIIQLLLTGYTQKEIASLYDVSQAYISRVKKKFETFLRKYKGEHK